MRKKLFLLVILLVFCSVSFYGFVLFPLSLSAQFISPPSLFISEIMYDPDGTDTGREWIEIYNAGSESVDLSAWKLFEANVAHKITFVSGDVAGSSTDSSGNSVLPPGTYAVIADNAEKFLAEFSDVIGLSGGVPILLFDSVFSLGNVGETISMRSPDGIDIDIVTYSAEWGANGNTMSLQKTFDNRWIASVPTPGAKTTATQSAIVSDVNDSGSSTNNSKTATDSLSTTSKTNTSVSAHASQSIENTKPDQVELEVTSGRDRIGVVGSPIQFSAKIKSAKNATGTPDFFWSFGDGMSKSGQSVYHTYKFPGDYIVILNANTKNTNAVSKTTVKIIEPEIVFVSIGKSHAEIMNMNNSELNIGGFSLWDGKNRFFIASDTLIAGSGVIKIPLYQSVLNTNTDISLLDSSGQIIARYGSTGPVAEVFIDLPDGLDIESLSKKLKSVFANSANQ